MQPTPSPASIALVAAGGVIGSVARYGLQNLVNPTSGTGIPTATLIINIVGCFLIGALVPILDRSSTGIAAKPFLITGVLGGFTTFSAFAIETVQLVDHQHVVAAGCYVLMTVAGGLFAVSVGLWVTRRWSQQW
jgi:fluoride exporter